MFASENKVFVDIVPNLLKQLLQPGTRMADILQDEGFQQIVRLDVKSDSFDHADVAADLRNKQRLDGPYFPGRCHGDSPSDSRCEYRRKHQ